MLYKIILKPVAFLIDPEKAHKLGTGFLKFSCNVPILSSIFKKYFLLENKNLEKTVCGLHFKNPIGLAAGFDKDGKYFSNMSHLGFGFIEIGTVTPKPQEGNPKKRLFRLPKDNALINRMGFNNEGVDALVERLANKKRSNLIIGGNIGKNKVTPNHEAVLDYELCFNKLYELVDYFVVNVSSPNTPGLRSLQDKEPLTQLLKRIIELRDEKEKSKPVFLKIAPDLSFNQIDEILEIVTKENVDGIIATNTTISREELNTNNKIIQNIGNGGLSGLPLFKTSLSILKYIKKQKPQLPIIAVGGIDSPQKAKEMLENGADLIQIYSGLIYEGPSLVKKIKTYLTKS